MRNTTVQTGYVAFVLAIAGCGGAPVVVEPSIELRVRASSGAQYQVVIAHEATIPRLHGRARSVGRGTLEVTSVDAGAITLRSREEWSRLELPDTPVRLPPLTREGGCEVELRIDATGSAVGDPVVVGGGDECEWLERVAIASTSVLPGHAVGVGDTWPMRSGPVALGARTASATREGEVQLARIEGGTAELVWHGTTLFEPIEAADDASIRASLTTRGSAAIALADGLSRHGRVSASASYEITGDADVAFLPTEMETSWCLAGAGDPPCEVPEPPSDQRPAARTYEGQACTARVAALDATLGALPTQLLDAGVGEVPSVPAGAPPIASVAPVVRVGAEAIMLDGRVVTIDRLLEDLSTLDRNWGLLHPGTAAPRRVWLVAAPTTPLTSLEPVLTALLGSRDVAIVVSTGRLPARPPLPAWAGTAPTEPAERASFLGRTWGTAVAGCAPAIRVLGALAGTDATSRQALLRRGMVEAVVACRCEGVDVDAIEALGAHTAIVGELALSELVIPQGASGPILTVRRAGTADDLVRALVGRATPDAHVRLRWR